MMNTALARVLSAGLIIVVAASTAWVGERWLALRSLQQTLATLNEERRVLAAQVETPEAGALAALEAEIADAGSAVTTETAAPGASAAVTAAGDTGSVAEGSADAFFELAEFVAGQRAQARASGVTIADNECFGFGAYAQAGPPPAAIPRLLTQRRAAERVLAELFAARPQRLLSFECDSASEERTAGATMTGGDGAAEHKGRDPVPAEAAGFRVVFTGQTRALRRFLNALAGIEPPLVVRAVEVRPEEPARAAGGAAAADRTRDIGTGWSRFTVAIASGSLPAAESGPAASGSAGIWAEASGLSDKARNERDLFTAPELWYDGTTRRYSLRLRPTRALESTADALPAENVGLELLAVEPVPFRLQLLGVVGDRPGYRAIVENQSSGEVLLAAAGTRIDALDLTVCEVTLQCEPVALSAETTAMLSTAVAIVRDERTGARVTLTDRHRLLTEEWAAVFASAGSGQANGPVRVGDVVGGEGEAFRIDKIHLAPPAVTVTKLGAGQAASGSRTLLVPVRAAPEPLAGNLCIQ